MASCSPPIVLFIIFSYFLFFSVSSKKIPTSRAEMIEAVCKTVEDAEGCSKTVAENPDATASKDLISMARAVIGIATTHARETLEFIKSMIKTDPAEKTLFEESAEYYDHIVSSLKRAAGNMLRESPIASDYMVMRTFDDTQMTLDAIRAAKGGASVDALKDKTRRMEGFIRLAMGGIDAVEEYYGEK